MQEREHLEKLFNVPSASFLNDQEALFYQEKLYSAAYDNDTELVDSLIEGQRHNMFYIAYGVRGAAANNHEGLMLRLIAQATDQAQLLNEAAWSAAYSNQVELLENTLLPKADIQYAVRGAAAGGWMNLMNHLILLGGRVNEALWSAASKNQLAIVEDLLARGGNLDQAIRGAAAGGHLDLVNSLHNRGASLSEAAWSAGNNNQWQLAAKLIENPRLIPRVRQGAIAAGHKDLLNKLVQQEIYLVIKLESNQISSGFSDVSIQAMDIEESNALQATKQLLIARLGEFAKVISRGEQIEYLGEQSLHAIMLHIKEYANDLSTIANFLLKKDIFRYQKEIDDFLIKGSSLTLKEWAKANNIAMEGSSNDSFQNRSEAPRSPISLRQWSIARNMSEAESSSHSSPAEEEETTHSRRPK